MSDTDTAEARLRGKATPALKRTLDFVVAGAQKGGTTTLWHHLAGHPQLAVPEAKEVPYFSHDEIIARGWAWYVDEHFRGVPVDVKIGTVTPQYMVASADASEGKIARRMHKHAPDMRVIMLLRDPIGRARSHYRMAARRGIESRSFSDAMRECLEPQALELARRRPTPRTSYVSEGEYSRVLRAYLKSFPLEQVHLALTTDLERDAQKTLSAIFAFLAVDPDHRLTDAGRRDHVGGVKPRLDPEATSELMRQLDENVFPATDRPIFRRRAFEFWFNVWNIAPGEGAEPLDPEVERSLREHFASDARRLERLTGLSVPWCTVPPTA